MAEKSRFIINTSAEYFSAVCSQDTDSIIREFFENEDITVLAATRNKGKIQFQHSVPTEENCLLFYKIPQVGPTQPDCPVLGILTLEGGMVKSIYNSVSRVFSSHGFRKKEYNPELSELLENLHVSLGSTLGLPPTGITSIQDEINFWNQKSANSSTKLDREQAQIFATMLEKINKQIKQIDQNSLSTVEEFLDSAHNNLDEIWRLPHHYPQNRMADLMDVICNQIIETCVESLKSEDVWNISSYHVSNLLNQILDITDSWMQLCDSLTRLFWPNYSQHAWTGKPHIPKRGQQFKDRLAEVKNIKNLFKQIVTLLGDPSVRSMLSRNSPFKAINIYDTTSIGQMKWNKALNQFEYMLQPIDEKIAQAIKSQLYNHLSNPRQVVFIFSKYDTLIQRPNVLELLTIEREQFLQSLHILLQDLRKAMSDTNIEPDTGHLSRVCNECRWLKIIQYQVISKVTSSYGLNKHPFPFTTQKIMEIEKVSHLLSGRDGFEKINQNIHELKEETETLLRTNFEIWGEQCLSDVKKGDLRLRDDQSVVQFEKEGRQLMRVTFNPKLVTFCQDVREFQNMGYMVPIELRSSASHAAKFMSYARRLQQIATFHNTIGDRMIPCQRPIMLKNALELSKLVQSESVAWNDEESVKRYVSMLQDAVSKLSADNNLLVGYHEQAKRTVMKLMNTDLLSQGQLWKDEMRHLRELVATLESQGYLNLDAFKLHWDHQLYKVLEYQYILGLVDMNNKLPNLHIDIVFRQRQLQFRPPEEEIRSKYFSQLKKFIERPLGFRGISDKSSELFKVMVERNRNHFGPLYKRSEELFKKLQEFKNLWLPWIALGCVDIEELCNVHLTKWEDWDINFKACKHFSQQIAKIQNSEEIIDCFIINILPLRSDIEFIGRRYWEALSSSLRSSIVNDISSIQEFIQSSLQFLQNVPMEESSIAESGTRYEKICAEIPNVSETLEIVRGKDKCLAGWCKERVSALSNLIIQWEKLLPLIENHSAVLQRQVDIMKNHVGTQVLNLKDEVEKFTLRWDSTVAELEANEDTSLDLFKERLQNWGLIKQRQTKLLEDAQKLNMEIPPDMIEIFEKAERKIASQSKQWEIYEQFLNELEDVAKEEWAIYRKRPYVLTEFITKWEGSVHSSLDLASSRIRQTVEHYQSMVPILQHLHSDALTEKHWIKLFQLMKKEPKSSHNIVLKDILDTSLELFQISNEIQNLVRQAASEQIVRQALNELDQWAVTALVKLTTHTVSSGDSVSLVKDYNEILNKIGDNQSLLQSAKNSAAFDSFSDQAEIWESRLNTLDQLLTSLNQSQRKWVYLEPVFGAGTLKNEQALFQRIDKDFRYIMREIQRDSRVISIAKINNITTIINSLESQLSRCQNTLVSFMTEKRNTFPRFYFLGDDDLLEVLGQATKDEVIQKHIKKLFPGINSLVIERTSDTGSITAIKSDEGDVMTLTPVVKMQDSIENWLTNLVKSVQDTLKEQVRQCSQVQDLSQDILQKYPLQVICTSRAINFTRQAERAITSMALPSLQKALKEQVAKFADMKNQTKDFLMQTKLKGLLLDLVHYITVTQYLLGHNVTNTTDWHWLQQMKFYLKPDGKVYMKMVFAEFEYSYEFLGNPNKLVHTSLTHKCYLTLTQAMYLGLGGNPFGPAGTGKTECVKALGGMLGRLVLVFNCDENVDTEAMGLILTGLARCGAWGCFDEFNRLQEATLSAISMLIQPIQTALKDKNESVSILDKSVKLNHHCGIFVTLNPAGEEYGGRQQLPGNIQALFRPIVMQQPEPLEICRVMLFVEGFKNADEIAGRIVELFDLNKKILSAQKHYDWGLRELKTILQACGKEFRSKSSEHEQEMDIVVKALRSNTMSKLNLDDSKRFNMILTNVFPEVKMKLFSHSDISNSIQDSFSTLGFYKNDSQTEKALQLYEQLTKRMGVVVVGPPHSGKTAIISILKQALISTGKTIRTYTISPKSMSKVQLLGRLDPDTRQWNDGVLTTTAVVVNSEPQHINSWLICDGDIDPEWIEALNSVLDDNKLLTLPSGWRIQFGNNVNFIFETHELSHASPATISRMGIINVSSEDLPIETIIEAFLEREEYNELLRNYIEKYLCPSVDLLIQQYSSPIQVSKATIIKSALQNITNVKNKEDFCASFIKALLPYVTIEKQTEFANWCYETAGIYIPDPQKADLVYFNTFRDTVDIFEPDARSTNPDTQLVQTAQMKICLDVVRGFLKSSCIPFTILGPAGCGKTVLLKHAITEFPGYQLVVINCSSQLTPNYILHTLKQNCITVSGIRGREYKPQQSRVLMFFKNLDLCYMDSWGTRDVVELLLQLIQRNGFYAANLEWISVTGLQICSSVSNKSGQKLSPRFLSCNSYLAVNYPTESDMNLIIRNFVEPIVSSFKDIPHVDILVDTLIDFFKQIQDQFTLDKQSHYSFTPKKLVALLQGLNNYSKDHFGKALITEMETLFRNLLTTTEDLREYDSIVKSTLLRILTINDEDIYFMADNCQRNSFIGTSTEKIKEIVQKNITICNTETFMIDTPVTDEALSLTATISRLISRFGTHIVCVGQPGSGFIDALYIAATICSSRIYIPQGGKYYTIAEFYNDLKVIMQSAALEDQTAIFLIDQCWINYLPDIMKPVEAILEGSEIIDLFGDDLESVASSLKSAAQLEGYTDSLSSFFLNRAKRNLRITLNFDMNSNRLTEIFQRYPALYRNAEIIWFQPPSMTTLTALPKTLIGKLSEGRQRLPVPKYFSDCIELIFQEPPQRYYQLIMSYYEIYNSFDEDIKKRLKKLKMGVEKLAAAHEVVGSLKSEAVKQEVALAEKRKLANDALELISSTMRNANDQKSDLLELKRRTQENSEYLMERKKAIEQELSEVEPILKEASAAVGQIKSEALSEIRSLRAPPETIRDILEGVLRLMGIRDTSWNSMKSFLAKRGVKEDIRSLDPSRISPENCDAVERLLKSKVDSFDMKNAKRASAAAAPLATWVIASVKYAKVVQSIKPLEREQYELQRNLDSAESEMRSLMSGLDDVDARVKQLSGQLNVYTQEAAVLELKLEEARNTLRSSEVLVEKLSTEYQSWNKQLDQYDEKYNSLDATSFLISYAINYLLNLTYEKRLPALEELTKHLNLQDFDIRANLISDQDQIIWESMGLARDAQAIENAALLSKVIHLPFGSHPIPLLIDPSESACNWLEANLKSQKIPVEVISQNSQKLTYTIELAIRFGKILLIQDCQELFPPVMQIVFARIYSKYSKRLIQVGNKLIDCNENFKLLLITKFSKPNIAPEVQSYITQIPFTTTVIGLKDQLISRTILFKRPELEKKRIELLQNEGTLLKQRIELEDRLLEELSKAQGDVLKNEKLLATLNEVKKSSADIENSLKESNQVKETLFREYSQFENLCERSSNFYIGLCSTYDISTEAFISLFIKSLDHLESVEEAAVYSHLIKITYQYLCRSTPKQDHLTLGMLLCKNAFPENISVMEWELFVTNFVHSEDYSTFHCPAWIKKETKPKVLSLMGSLPNFYRSLDLDNEKLWSTYIQGERDEIPVQITPFQKVLAAQIFRPEIMLSAMNKLVLNMIGANPEIPVQLTIEQLADESDKKKPILMVTATGCDPSSDIKISASKRVGSDKYAEISIGRGLEKIALNQVKSSAEAGKWICVKNAHLVPNWLLQIDRELEAVDINGNFRLWIICDSSEGFAPSFTHKCIKVLQESPNGLKNKIRQLLQKWSTSLSGQTKDPKVCKLHVVTFVLNSVLQERLKYIPQGWSRKYEFGDSDLRIALEFLKWVNKDFGLSGSNWQILQGLFKYLAYGGRINNWHDLQILDSLLRDFLCEKVLGNRWSPLEKNVCIPTTLNIQEYFDAIQKFPDIDQPEEFGLSPSSNLTRNIAICRNTIKTLRNAYYQHEEQSTLEKRIRPILSLWRKLASNSTVDTTVTELYSKDANDPWEAFVFGELRLTGYLFKEIHSTLTHIHSICKEIKSYAGRDDVLIKTLADNQVPLHWRQLWTGPKTAIDFLKAVVIRGNEAERRYKNDINLDFIDSIDFTRTFNPEAFFSALKMANSHKLQKSSCDITLLSSQNRLSGAIVVEVSPLIVDGANFKDEQLVLFDKEIKDGTRTPKFYITFSDKKNVSSKYAGGISLPLYSNSAREKFICSLNVMTSESSDAVLSSGAALIIPEF